MSVFGRMVDAIRYIVRKADMVLLALCLVSTAYGIVLIASATNFRSNTMRYVLVQAAAAVIGIGLYFLFSNLDMEHFSEKWWLFLIFNLGFIALLVPFGVERNNSKAWLSFSWMPMDIQPAEVVKLTFTVLLAKQLAWFRENRRMRGLESLLWPAAHTGLMFVWIYVISSDAGSGLVYLVIFAGMAFAAGLAWYWFAAGFGVMGLGIGALALLDKLPGYMVERFRVLFDHSYDPQGVGWQQTRSLMALGSGGVFGQGLFNGIQTQSAFKENLPERADGLYFLRLRRGTGNGGVPGDYSAGVFAGVALLSDGPCGQADHGKPDLRGLWRHADFSDGGEYRHVPLCHAGDRADAALFQLRGKFHCDAVRRHGDCLRRAQQDAAGLAAKDMIARPTVLGRDRQNGKKISCLRFSGAGYLFYGDSARSEGGGLFDFQALFLQPPVHKLTEQCIQNRHQGDKQQHSPPPP